jgi:hypothetical protein
MNDDFYVGYVARAPAALGRRIKRIVIGLVAASLAVSAALILDQAPFAASKFEYGIYQDYSGVIEAWPYPILRTNNSSFLLIGTGKHGVSEAVRGLQGKRVRLKASLIQRGQDRMLEVVPVSMQETGSGLTRAVEQTDLGSVRLRGEIVDSKCYLGVMNPGNGKVHRDCAVRCISGGAPPAFIARDASGETRVLLLTGSDGRALHREVLPFVAEPLLIAGELVRSGSHLILKAEPSRFRRDSGIKSPAWCIR